MLFAGPSCLRNAVLVIHLAVQGYTSFFHGRHVEIQDSAPPPYEKS